MENKSSRNYKDGTFRLLFNSKKKMLELYNALENTNYTDENLIEVQTLQDAMYNVYKNDLAFTIDNKFIILIEHQSTISVNIAIRLLIYMSRIYENLVDEKDLYKTKAVNIPVPSFYVLYNGKADYPAEKEIKLSDLYDSKEDEINLELKAKIININYDVNNELIQKSETMNEYSHFIHIAREYEKTSKTRDEALKKAIDYCIKNEILKEFLENISSEVFNMLFTEITLEDYGDIRYEEGREERDKEIQKKMKEAGLDPELIKQILAQ